MNLRHNNFSTSSACLILIDRRVLLKLLSIKTCSLSFLLITRGVRRISVEHADSISGLLWRSTTCELNCWRDSAAVREVRTAFKYGFSVVDYSVNCGRERLYHPFFSRNGVWLLSALCFFSVESQTVLTGAVQ